MPARLLPGILAALVISLPAYPDEGDDHQALRDELKDRLGKAAGRSVSIGEELTGRLIKARGELSKEDRKVLEHVTRTRLHFHQHNWPLQDALSLIGKEGEVKVVFSKKVQALVDEGGKIDGVTGSDLSFEDALELVSKQIGTTLAWSISSGALQILTAEEEEIDREEHREKMREIIQEVAGEDARLIGERFLLVYVDARESTPEARRIRSVLSNMKVTINFDETALDAILTFIRDVTELNVVLSSGVQDQAGDLTVTLSAKEIRVESALNLILDGTGEDLEWTIKNDVLFIRTQEEGERDKPSRSFVLIDISDILFIPPDFPAPKLGLDGLQRER